ncbi:MAG TPA: PVC-type heme-binding CxxCH protein, partial [Longimicrobiaceae bacterium]
DQAHVALFDHPDNAGFPQPWRVDGQFGIGPVRARLGDWSIPAGQTETIRHRLVFYTGSLSDVEILELWESYSGRGGTYTTTELWNLARAEGREARHLEPEEAAAAMTPLEGFTVNAWAGEPMLTQPMAFAWDDRGRLWIAENRDYESRSRGYSGSGDSRILILEDTDRDGRADSRKVFLEGIPFPSAIAVGFDGLFLGAPPHLLFVPDRNRDDVAERDDIEIRLTGWGIRDRHETINSLHWGPDGWLYGLEGFATPSKVRKPTAADRLYAPGDSFPDVLEGEGVPIDGGVWRYHPTKDRFEVVAHGFSNPWGIDYDAKGELFISACVIPHVFHVIPGGIYQRQGGQHFNPYVYSDIQHIVDHRHRSAHGGARVYQSDAFPAEHRGRLFMANIHEHAVLSDALVPKGSGFVASHGDDFLMANNAQWIGFSVEVGPDGALYVLDWHDPDITGGSVTGKETGRVFRIAPEVSLAESWEGRYSDLSTWSDARLAELQSSESDWHARRARVILQHRATQRAIDRGARRTLEHLFDGRENVDLRLRGMWALHVTGLLTGDRLMQALDDPEPYVRAWAVRLLTEDLAPDREAVARFARMARQDDSPVVRKYLAAALQRMPEASRWEVAAGLAGRAEDADDHNIPKLLWYGVEPGVAASPERALALAGESAVPAVTEFVARRLVDADMLDPLMVALERYPRARVALLRGMRTGMAGRTDLHAPGAWARLLPLLEADPEVAPVAREVAQFFGDAGAAR